MQDCLFCKIVKGDIPSVKVHEDEDTLAFLNIQAINAGHTLVIPKQHTEEFQDLGEKDYSKLMSTVKNVAASLKKTYQPVRVGLMVQGFEVAHAHIHVVPLYEVTDITSKKLLESATLSPTEEEREEEAGKIKANMQS